MLAENRRKNVTFGLAKDLQPDLRPREMTWSWDAARQLLVKILRFDAAFNADWQAACDLQFGPKQVKVLG
jgi:hypothetical protein